MKTAIDIRKDFSALSVTRGAAPCYTCNVTLPGGETVRGYGSSLASAEDTAWHGVKITLRDSLSQS